MGIAYHAHYLVWFEIGRTELLRGLGCSYADLERRGVMFPVVRVGVSYRRSARYDDELEVRTRVTRVGGSRVRFDYDLVRPADGATLAEAFTEHATVGEDGRPKRMPRNLRERLAQGGGSMIGES